MFLIAFPLLLIPFALYNMAVFLLDLSPSLEIAELPLPTDTRLPITLGEALIGLALLLLYLEALKTARFGSKVAMDHVLAFLIFAAMAAELALVPKAQTSTFLILTAIALMDLLIGVSVGARGRPRNIVIEDTDQLPD